MTEIHHGGYSPLATVAAPGAPVVRLADWKPYRSGQLRGFLSVVIGRSLRVNSINVMMGERGPWLSMPSRPMTSGGQPMLDAQGRQRYQPILEWTDRAARKRFNDAALRALLSEHPDALGAVDGGF